jgi:hypothetical protein
MRASILLVAIVLLAGCSSTPVSDNARPGAVSIQVTAAEPCFSLFAKHCLTLHVRLDNTRGSDDAQACCWKVLGAGGGIYDASKTTGPSAIAKGGSGELELRVTWDDDETSMVKLRYEWFGNEADSAIPAFPPSSSSSTSADPRAYHEQKLADFHANLTLGFTSFGNGSYGQSRNYFGSAELIASAARLGLDSGNLNSMWSHYKTCADQYQSWADDSDTYGHQTAFGTAYKDNGDRYFQQGHENETMWRAV